MNVLRSLAHARVSVLCALFVSIAGVDVASAQTGGTQDPSAGQDPMTTSAPADGTTTAEPTMTTMAAPMPVDPGPAPDGPRFRFGFALVGGLERVPDVDFGAWNVGVDLRLGVQLNDLIGIYVEPHFSGGKGGYGGAVQGSTGIFSTTAMVDFTLFDRLVLGAGVGYGVLNNPRGPAIEARAAFYPVMGRPDPASPRRKGLMIGVTFRTIFSDVGNGLQFTGSLGYEAF